ncbi:HNH endonuclease family protein [Clostridium botulinum]|nr:HNH endonuclease family protein [Clostridium botulinum]
MEKYYRTTDELAPFNVSLEHILSQSSNSKNMGMIGNLLPLSRVINNSIKDKDLEYKIEEYKSSELIIVKKFVEKNSGKKIWKEKDIEERTCEIAKLAYEEIWKF